MILEKSLNLSETQFPHVLSKNNNMRVCELSCAQLCDLIDCSLPDSSVHGVFQERIVEWVAISFSKDLSIQRLNQRC